MRRASPAPARAGMTLIELLVVMMIIATLASLVLSAVFTVREAQMKNFTEAFIQKLASALDQQWKAAVDQIREEPVPPWALTMAKGDQRIAKVIYLKARLKQEFPVSFYQAIYPNANYTPTATSGQSGAYQTPGGAADLPPKPSYAKALAPLIGTPTQVIPAMGQAIPVPDQYPSLNLQLPEGFEASALLYLSLAQGRRGQTGFNPDEAVEPTAIKTATLPVVVSGTPTSVTFKYFADPWGGPVRFWAFPYGNLELNGPPYLQTTTASGVNTPQNQQSPDPQDPEQALAQFTGVNYPGSAKFAAMVHPPAYPLHNLTVVVGSAGRNTRWGVDYFDMSLRASPPYPATEVGADTDNIYSYRLRRVGRRGD